MSKKAADRRIAEMNAKLERIAREVLSLDSLTESGADFREQAVWCIKEALVQAYNAGMVDGAEIYSQARNKRAA